MTYTIQIDQSHSIEWGLNLSEATLFSFCYNLPAWAETAIINNQVWYFASRNKAIDEMPLITDKPDTVYRLYRALQSKGLIEWQKIGVKDFVRLTEKAKEWNSEKNPSDGKKSESTRKKIRATSENFPTYHNTIDNNTIDREDTPAQFHVQVHSLETIPTVEGEVPRPAPDAPDWMEVAKLMEAHAKGKGAAQWRFMCEAQGYTGEVLPIVSNWASKASKYQLQRWEDEFRKLQTWLKTESRADYKAAQRPGQPAAPTTAPVQIRREL